MEQVCIICSDPIGVDENGWGGGHNARPVAQGQCCITCNRDLVIPARFRLAGYSDEEIALLPEDIA